MADAPVIPAIVEFQPSRKSRLKKAGIAFLLSLLVPGLGQIYNRQPRKGLLMAITILLLELFVIETRLFLFFWGLILMAPVLQGWRLLIAGEASRAAWTMARPESTFRKPKLTVSIFIGIVLLITLVLEISPYTQLLSYFRAFRVPSESMCPTVCPGERIVGDMTAYQEKGPQRGDLILFRNDKTGDQMWIKRVIGLAGDTVESGPQGKILVNGNAIQFPGVCGKPILDEDLAGESLEFSATRVSENSLFVVGDNLNHSYDSRIPEFGLVSLSQVLGKPAYIYWSYSRSRFGCAVR